MNEIPTVSLDDIRNNLTFEKLSEYKNHFYAHRSLRSSLGDSHKEQKDSLEAKVRGASAWVQGLSQDCVEALSEESDGLSQYLCGLACFETSQHGLAVKHLENSLNNGGPEEGRHRLIENLILNDDTDKAEEKLAALSDADAETHYCRGLLFEARLKHDEAISHFSKCLEINSHHRYALFRLGQIHNLYGNDEEAVKYYEKCREELPVILACLINLGVIYEDMLKFQEAVYCFEEILETEPNNKYAMLYLNDVNQSFNMQYDEESERLFDHQNRIMKMKICDFELSVRSRNCLERMNIYTINDLVNKSEAELLSYPNFGETSLQEIKEILNSKNIQLGQKLGGTFGTPAFGRPGVQDQVDPKLKTSIATLKLSVRSTKVLETLGVMNLGQLVAFTEDQLMAQKNFGSTSIREIKSKLTDFGLELQPKKSKRQTEDASILASMKPSLDDDSAVTVPSALVPSADGVRPIEAARPMESLSPQISIVKPEGLENVFAEEVPQQVISMPNPPEAITEIAEVVRPLITPVVAPVETPLETPAETPEEKPAILLGEEPAVLLGEKPEEKLEEKNDE
jgi:DNA-directed RNA polymerase subunit alpha